MSVRFQKFWMVLGAGTPVNRHFSEHDARREAARLAEANPSTKFFVLESIACCEATKVTWSAPNEEIDLDYDVPF